MKVVFSFHVSSILICQEPRKRLSVMKMLLPLKSSKISSTHGTGHLLFFITAFNFRKSTQNLGLTSFFVANTIGDVHADSTGVIILALSIRSTSFLSISLQLRTPVAGGKLFPLSRLFPRFQHWETNLLLRFIQTHCNLLYPNLHRYHFLIQL